MNQFFDNLNEAIKTARPFIKWGIIIFLLFLAYVMWAENKYWGIPY